MSEQTNETTAESGETVQKMQSLSLNDNSENKKKEKVDILLKPTGDVPIMKQKKWNVDADKPISWIAEFVKKYIKMDREERLFIYVNQTFAPAPDQTIRNLYDCYATENKLVLHYCRTPAWG